MLNQESLEICWTRSVLLGCVISSDTLPGWCFVSWPPARWLPRPLCYVSRKLGRIVQLSALLSRWFCLIILKTSEPVEVWVIHLMACLMDTWEAGNICSPLAHLLEVQFTSHRWKVLKIRVKIPSSDLEIMFQNAKLNMRAGISSSPLWFAVLRGNAELG